MMEPTMVPLEGVFGWVLGVAGLILNLFYIFCAAEDLSDGNPSNNWIVSLGVLSIVLIMIGSGLVTAYDILHYMG